MKCVDISVLSQETLFCWKGGLNSIHGSEILSGMVANVNYSLVDEIHLNILKHHTESNFFRRPPHPEQSQFLWLLSLKHAKHIR